MTPSRRDFLNLAVGSTALAALPRRLRAAGHNPPALGPLTLDSPRGINELDTPALLIDYDAMERNLVAMARHAAAQGIGLRPHVKTHKCPIIAKRQVELGAVGVCAAKVSEAEVMVDAGIENVLITSPVATPEKIRRIVSLAARTPGLQVVIDRPQNAQDFDEAAAAAGLTLRVLIGLDTGTRRTGSALGEPALKLARTVGRLRNLQLDGLQAYAGHVMHAKGYESRKQRSIDTISRCLETRLLLEREGFEIGVFTGGGTGTFDIDSGIEGMTDLQVGSYLFMDVQYRAIGDADSDVFDAFEPSLFVLATAISQPVADRITVDAGYKAFANERNSKPEFRRLEGLKYYYGGDEHGIVIFTTDARPLQLGDKAQLIISHCDPTVNLYDYYHIVQDGRVKQLWPISARGCSQ